ncbi:MAG: pyridoxal-phosphate dependent enzyme [Cyanobacteria bacterium SZAS LIN-5]|nr:pyridoxal-phosphate dependent enzyme [Cyanobacteria bacterium SZAS LIN-5]
MHELRGTGHQKIRAPQTGTAQTDSDRSDITDLVEDLCEIRFLLDGLCFDQNEFHNYEATYTSLFSQSFADVFNKDLKTFKSKHHALLDLVERAARWSSSADLRILVRQIRKDALDLKSAIRQAYRHRGLALCAADWQSPVYASTFKLELNRFSDPIKEHAWDYKRDGHLDAVVYEEAFIKAYLATSGSSKCKAYLTNSGMAGYTTVLHWLAHEMDLGTNAVALQPMYFENIHLARQFFPSLSTISDYTKQDLLHTLRQIQPTVVLCDAVTNCGDILRHDIETVLNWASHETTRSTAIVIDTTCQPAFLMPKDFLGNIPENVSVILIESLAKHHQFGMDNTTAGIVVAHLSETHHNEFRKTRARLGTNITDQSVGCLPAPDRFRLEQRMRRHSLNIDLITRELQSTLENENGVLEGLSHLSLDPQLPWYRGACLTLKMKREFRTVERFQEFEHAVMQRAARKRCSITLGTSFGFDVTRFYVTAPSTPFEEPFLRLAVGTEPRLHIKLLCEIIDEINTELGQVWEKVETQESGSALNMPLPSIKRITTAGSANTANRAVVTTPDSVSPKDFTISTSDDLFISRTVFSGDDSLKSYLSPSNYAPTPLVELPADLNPFRGDGVRIFAKMMPLVPLMNIKSVPAFSMLSKAFERGDLSGVSNIIESSSSNTVLSLSVMSKLFGVENTTAIVDHNISAGLLRMLRLFGIEAFLHPAAGHEMFGKLAPRSERASKIGAQDGWFNPGQYTNPDNPEGFANWLAPHLWAQTNGELDLLACGLGTCGTMVGLSRGLRQRNPHLKVVACCPVAGQAVPGPREQSLLKDVTFDWKTVANAQMELTAEESFKGSIKLLRRGILGGPSSGMNYAGLLAYLQAEKDSGRLEQLIKTDGDLHCAFICCDSPLPHVNDYYDTLGEEYFPQIHDVPGEDIMATEIER